MRLERAIVIGPIAVPRCVPAGDDAGVAVGGHARQSGARGRTARAQTARRRPRAGQGRLAGCGPETIVSALVLHTLASFTYSSPDLLDNVHSDNCGTSSVDLLYWLLYCTILLSMLTPNISAPPRMDLNLIDSAFFQLGAHVCQVPRGVPGVHSVHVQAMDLPVEWDGGVDRTDAAGRQRGLLFKINTIFRNLG